MGVFCHSTQDRFRECRGNMRVNEHRRGRQRIYMMHHDSYVALIMEWQHPCAHFIENDSKRIDVTGWPNIMPLNLLRGKIERRTSSPVSWQVCAAKIGKQWFPI